jgi:hypothetical protein
LLGCLFKVAMGIHRYNVFELLQIHPIDNINKSIERYVFVYDKIPGHLLQFDALLCQSLYLL